MAKNAEKDLAIKLRTQGKTYAEILNEILVAKSTLSAWLHSVGLAKKQAQRITKKRIAGGLRGAQVRHTVRMEEIKSLTKKGVRDVQKVSNRELWLLGIALYWAEGSKQNIRSKSTGIIFGNSDSKMMLVFIKWLGQFDLGVNDMIFELYVHHNRKSDTPTFRAWWSNELSVPIEHFDRTYFKKGNPATHRSNIGDLYHGLLRIRVRNSTLLNRKVNGWVNGIVTILGKK